MIAPRTVVPHGAPVPLLVAAAVVLVEALVFLGYGVAELFHLAGQRVVMGLTTSLFFVVCGAALAGCAWGLTRARTWARGPVLLAQLMLLGLAWNFRDGDTAAVSVALLVPAVVVLVAMLHPRTIAALNDEAGVDDAGGDDHADG